MKRIFYKRLLAVCCVLLVFFQLVSVERRYRKEQEEAVNAEAGMPEQLTLWYTDEKLDAYLVETAAAFKEKTGVEITLQLVTAVDYIEHINNASISDLGGPDLFIAPSELLEKARLAGLTVENDSFSEKELTRNFPQKSIDAASCGGKLVAYPFYFETCFLLYNRNYTDGAPTTIDEILTYSDNFESGEETQKVETIFKWNVADIFYDFFFIAKYIDLGGATGDDPTQVVFSTEEVEQCLSYYQKLNEFFAIDADEVTTEGVLKEFIDGKIVYTIAKTDAIASLDAAMADSYGIAPVPDLSADLGTRGFSVTNSVMVNAYSKERDLAKEFARFLTWEKADELYTMANKMPVKLGVEYENPQLEVLLTQYEDSLEVTKLTDLSNYFIEMEIAFSNIWRGNEVSGELSAVNEKMLRQLADTE